LYAGPAINVLAVIMTAKVLGAQLGMARAIGAIALFGVMFTPALVVDGVVKLSGKVPSFDEAKRLLA
jgi:uncharacterized membrane protein YraQ (UPF0718 family)